MTTKSSSKRTSVCVALCGSGGAGVMTAGNLLLEAAAQAGWYGLMVRSSGPQIRGGEAAALMRIATHPIDCLDDRFDALIAVDWQNIHRFADEIPLDGASLIVGDPDQGEAPEVYIEDGCADGQAAVEADDEGDSRQLAEHDRARVRGRAARDPRRQGQGGRREIAEEGRRAAAREPTPQSRPAARRQRSRATRSRSQRPAPVTARRWLITGNQAAGFGAIRGGVRFVAAYPITPGNRAARIHGADAAPGRRRAGAGRGRARVDQHDHRRFLRRCAGAHCHVGAGPLPDDRGPRARGRRRDPDRRRRRDARRAVDRDSRQERAERRVDRALGPARRCAAARARTELDPRLPDHHAVGRAPRRGAAVPGDRALGSVLRTSAHRDRPARRHGRRRRTARRAGGRGRLQALCGDRVGHLADGDPRHARSRVHGRRPGALRARHSVERRRAITARSSPSASASSSRTTTARTGPTSKATATSRS